MKRARKSVAVPAFIRKTGKFAEIGNRKPKKALDRWFF